MNEELKNSILNLINATSDKVLIHQENFRIIENALNNLNEKLNASKMINSILVTSLAASSSHFKESLKFSLEQLLSSGYELPGDFEEQAKNLLAAVCGEPVSQSPKRGAPFLHLLQGGKQDQDE
jgi:hypothetical protein